jgi:phthiocerol/phenolphthiocerol synthesis type-I polyketide synthase E
MSVTPTDGLFDVAIVGLAGRWPGASDIGAFWTLLTQGREAIRQMSDDELRRRGVGDAPLRDPQFVKAASTLDDIDAFAAEFFGYLPREASLMDPQQRLFLECAWEALEDAGYAPRHVRGDVGVFASCSLSTYLLFNLLDADIDRDETFQVMLGTDKDFLATRVAYKLNLKGPGLTLQTGCSSSLVAVCLAAQSLLTFQCDMALAGGVSVSVPQRAGYYYQPGGIASVDGHCRPFGADATGTIFGDGLGIVVLKRLADARADRDRVYAVIKGSAINNDGSGKLGYTAPSVAGQASVIRRALAAANLSAETIAYVEAHGTATALGDQAEMAALTQAFRVDTEGRAFCALGSVKGNVGHLDAAAGVTGLIKTVLMLHHGAFVPSLFSQTLNPGIDFASSPFVVSQTHQRWARGVTPRRAGVSSFGIGGTNAHVVLEEALDVARAGRVPSNCILPLSADTPAALDVLTDRVAMFLADNPEIPLRDVAYTCQAGREALRYRRVTVCDRHETAAARLRARDPERVFAATTSGSRSVAFMFPGGGAQYVGMGHDLYRVEPVFRAAVDRGLASLRDLGLDQRSIWDATAPASEVAADLERLGAALPSVFLTSYALAQVLDSWGVRPRALIGHSLGEYVAACLAGVFSLQDALAIVALRGALIDELPPGAMLSVQASEEALAARALPGVVVAAINAPATCVISGTPEAIGRAARTLEAEGITCARLAINAAAHSPAVEPIIGRLRARLQTIDLQPPRVPFVSNVTGTWITNEQAIDPEYWVEHLRRTVRFSSGLSAIAGVPEIALLEVGPGRTLSSLAKGQRENAAIPVVATMRHAKEQRSDDDALSEAIAKLWLAGVDIDWDAMHEGHDVRRTSIPTYPFERERFWVAPPAASDARRVRDDDLLGIEDWYSVPGWTRTWPSRSAEPTADDVQAKWILLADAQGVADDLRATLAAAGAMVFSVEAGDAFGRLDETRFRIEPSSAEDFRRVLRDIASIGDRSDQPLRIVHLWSLSSGPERPEALEFAALQRVGLFSLVACAKAAAQERAGADILVVTNRLAQVGGLDPIVAAKHTLHAGALVLPQELPGVRCKVVDIGNQADTSFARARLAQVTLAECVWDARDAVIAYRGAHRWSRRYERISAIGASPTDWIREDGVYVIVGGTGQIGLTLAEWLASVRRCRLALIGRTGASSRTTALARLDAVQHARSEIVVHAVNAADPDQLRRVFDQVEQQWGRIDGVLHLAGVTGAATLQTADDFQPGDAEPQFEAKVRGTYALAQVLRTRDVEFCVTFSSTASILGGAGMLSYAAANAFLDAAAATTRAGVRRWLSVNWDAWRTPNASALASAALERYALPADRAIEVLGRLLSSEVSGQVIVSSGDLPQRIARWTASPPRNWSTPPSASQPRPHLNTDYVAPATTLEQNLASIWSEVLGVDRIGRHDSFFELGGNSVQAIQIAQRARRRGLALSPDQFFRHETIARLAAAVAVSREDEPASPAPTASAVSDDDLRTLALLVARADEHA